MTDIETTENTAQGTLGDAQNDAQPTPDPEATDDAQEPQEDAQDDTEGEPQEKAGGNREAAKYRRQLREAETKLAEAQARIAELENADRIRRLAAAHKLTDSADIAMIAAADPEQAEALAARLARGSAPHPDPSVGLAGGAFDGGFRGAFTRK